MRAERAEVIGAEFFARGTVAGWEGVLVCELSA